MLLGFGPFRWVCTSLDPSDLKSTDEIAARVMVEMLAETTHDASDVGLAKVREQLRDNLKWIQEAGSNKLVVGSQARILYSDAEGRRRIALAFNEAIGKGEIQGPIVLSRDHHDVSGTDRYVLYCSLVTILKDHIVRFEKLPISLMDQCFALTCLFKMQLVFRFEVLLTSHCTMAEGRDGAMQ